MNQDTRRKLLEINLKVARKYKDRILKKEKPWEFEKEIVKEVLPQASPKERYMLEKAMEDPSMRRKMDSVHQTEDPTITSKIRQEVDAKIRHAIQDGELPDPSRDREYRAFMRKMHDKN